MILSESASIRCWSLEIGTRARLVSSSVMCSTTSLTITPQLYPQYICALCTYQPIHMYLHTQTCPCCQLVTILKERQLQSSFCSLTATQIGTDYWLKVLDWDCNTTVHLELWDLSGHTDNNYFDNLLSVYNKELYTSLVL